MENFSFIQITDHHLLETEDQLREGFSPGYALRMVMKHIAGNVANKADFIVSTGDLVEPETDATYQCAVRLLGIHSPAALPGPQKVNVEGLSDYPIYLLPGNHDDRALMTKYFFPESKAPGLYNFTFVHKGVQSLFMDVYKMADGCDALIVVTPWNEFKQLDLDKVKGLLKTPVIFDGRNMYDPARMKEMGFNYRAIGRGTNGK